MTNDDGFSRAKSDAKKKSENKKNLNVKQCKGLTLKGL